MSLSLAGVHAGATPCFLWASCPKGILHQDHSQKTQTVKGLCARKILSKGILEVKRLWWQSRPEVYKLLVSAVAPQLFLQRKTRAGEQRPQISSSATFPSCKETAVTKRAATLPSVRGHGTWDKLCRAYEPVTGSGEKWTQGKISPGRSAIG